MVELLIRAAFVNAFGGGNFRPSLRSASIGSSLRTPLAMARSFRPGGWGYLPLKGDFKPEPPPRVRRVGPVGAATAARLDSVTHPPRTQVVQGEPQGVVGLGPHRPRRALRRSEPQDVAGLGPTVRGEHSGDPTRRASWGWGPTVRGEHSGDPSRRTSRGWGPTARREHSGRAADGT